VPIRCFSKSLVILLASSTLLAPFSSARNKKPKPPAPKDEIEVVGHIALTDGPVKRFLTTQHYSSFYLYAEHEAGTVTLLDVTKTNEPTVLADVAYMPASGSGNLTVVAGTAALVSSESAAPTATAQPPQTIRIMDFSDAKNPKVAREFRGVTAMSRDAGRGLIFLANADGIWILHQRLAQDPEEDKAYANYVLYGPSMYRPGK
jgi:hypothetical protein